MRTADFAPYSYFHRAVADGIEAIGSNLEKFARDYSVPLCVRITKVRGF